ncbi:GYDIA family GHMP kinase [Salegentibacter sp. F188]|uniref:GYDIA family GHMP kinase n=1 Tax=Autumnicola patrickiae TaxID=3075591 RepID=A0ABU3E084_9FLAO|nr:GYDIA family GHMP kinase [Salegentibacter sp. F188]MDT0689392.1 GYDIA family GHMP kinase [Salegentibacter sp. F188]
MKKFHSNGKLLITGEYAVLNGAKALTIPTKFFQDLEVKKGEEPTLYWKSFDKDDKLWFEAEFQIENGEVNCTSENASSEVATRLTQILQVAQQLNPKILNSGGFDVESKLNFDQNWGLGTSSTLINNIAQWFEIDAYQLLEKTFGGSGFDIAAAQNNAPVTYQLTENGRTVLNANFRPSFKEELFFVYLNNKQNSRQAIAHYRNQSQENLDVLIDKISNLTLQFIECTNLQEFEMLIEIHETLIAQAINLPKVKTKLFKDYPGKIKSLGGWGGDFIMATGGESDKKYFRSKGYDTIFSYDDIIL